MNIRKMKRSSVIILALLGVIAVLGSAFALVYMTQTVNFHAGIATLGSLQVDFFQTTTIQTDFTFPAFNVASQKQVYNMTIRNTGNVDVNVTWSMTDLSYTWVLHSAHYYTDTSDTAWELKFSNYPYNDGILWYPNIAVVIPKGGSLDIAMQIQALSVSTVTNINPSILFSATN